MQYCATRRDEKAKKVRYAYAAIFFFDGKYMQQYWLPQSVLLSTDHRGLLPHREMLNSRPSIADIIKTIIPTHQRSTSQPLTMHTAKNTNLED